MRWRGLIIYKNMECIISVIVLVVAFLFRAGGSSGGLGGDGGGSCGGGCGGCGGGD